MQKDDALTIDALSLVDGADIHDVTGLVAMYRSVARDGLDATDLSGRYADTSLGSVYNGLVFASH